MMNPELEEMLSLRLQRSSYLALRNIRCICRDGVIILRGSLPTHYLKQLLLEIVAEIAGGYAIENEIGVIGPGQREPIGRAGDGRTGEPGRFPSTGPGAGAARGSRSEGRD
jgi:hypothetical protein